MTRKTYWVLTAALAGFALVSGAGDLLRQETVVRDLAQLGYPPYVMTLLGVVKPLAAAALVVPGWAGLKEWAYAGLVFEFGAAVFSSLAVGAFDADLAAASVALVLAAVAYVAFRRARSAGLPLGLLPARSGPVRVPA